MREERMTYIENYINDLSNQLEKTGIVVPTDQLNRLVNRYKYSTSPINEIIEAIVNTLSVTPPELASDIILNGIYLAGGGAQIRNLDNLIAQKTGVQTYVADTPLECVAIGAGKVLENIDSLKSVLMNAGKKM